jgi:hypothetical protein
MLVDIIPCVRISVSFWYWFATCVPAPFGLTLLLTHTKASPCISFERLQAGGFRIFPQTAHSVSPPAEPEIYFKEAY